MLYSISKFNSSKWMLIHWRPKIRIAGKSDDNQIEFACLRCWGNFEINPNAIFAFAGKCMACQIAGRCKYFIPPVLDIRHDFPPFYGGVENVLFFEDGNLVNFWLTYSQSKSKATCSLCV
ncbi:MAG: hypothetical protein A2Z34_10200 [Planctomycetes bacterium RBG_16_59_8]|nr:MAG: hypothetical protein A2Z34_10200 [Planctomycetes bacterium RBG_16_59_8]